MKHLFQSPEQTFIVEPDEKQLSKESLKHLYVF